MEPKKQKRCKCLRKINQDHCKMIHIVLNTKTTGFRCRYTNHGCVQSFDCAEIFAHEVDCAHRIVPCPWNGLENPSKCKSKVKFQHVLQHLTVKHNAKLPKITLGDPFVFPGHKNWSFVEPSKIEFDGKVFIDNIRIVNGKLCHWVICIGTPKDAEKYYFGIQYQGSKSHSGFIGFVASVDTAWDEILKNYQCYVMDYEVFKVQHLNEDRNFHYSVQMKKVGVDQPPGYEVSVALEQMNV